MHKVEAIISRTDSIKSFLRTRTYPVATVFEENVSTVQDKVRSRLVLFKIKDSSSQPYLFLRLPFSINQRRLLRQTGGQRKKV